MISSVPSELPSAGCSARAGLEVHVRPKFAHHASGGIELLHPRDSVPPMSSVAALTSVHLLTAEAISVSMIFEAPLVVSTESGAWNSAIGNGTAP
jgi:hypothetical protein